MEQETGNKENAIGYRKLIAWQKADELAFEIYRVTKGFPLEEKFGIVSQMRRAALSVAANIAEGYTRRSKKDKVHFYNIALGSLTEVEYYLDFSRRLKFLRDDDYEKLISLRSDAGRLLSGLVSKTDANWRTPSSFLAPCLLLLVSFLLFPVSTLAASLSVVADHASPDINQPVRVDVVLDTQGEDANAIQGRILYPARLFTLQSIADGSSPVSFWISPPKENASGAVAFAGIMPGGFTGGGRSVVTLILVPVASGSGAISLADVSLLRNDGKGTAIPVATRGQSISVSNVRVAPQPPAATSTVAPEPFTPVIARDPNVYDGKYFLAFSTTDKGSGIDHYDVAEVPAGSSLTSSSPWRAAESPYLLQDQALSSDIYVRAVNHVGNATIEKLPAPHAGVSLALLLAVVLGLALLGVLFWRQWHSGRRGRIARRF